MGLIDIVRAKQARNARALDLAPGKQHRFADGGFNLFKPDTYGSLLSGTQNPGPGPAPMYGGNSQQSINDWEQYNNQARAQSTAAAPVANYGAANSTLGQAQGEIGNADSAMGQEQNATNLLESAANGSQPSVAQVQMGQGISAGLRAQLAGAASARGGAYADSAAQEAAAGANEQSTAGSVSSSAALRAQEMENARTAYSSATQGMQAGDIAASGAEGNIASAQQAQGLSQAQLQAQQNALNVQGALGNDQLAQNIDTANLGASVSNQGFQAGANSQNAGFGQQLFGMAMNGLGGTLGGFGNGLGSAGTSGGTSGADIDLGGGRRRYADGDLGGPGAGTMPGGMGGLAAVPAAMPAAAPAPAFAPSAPGGAGLDAGTAGDYAQGLGAAGGAASPRGMTKADAMKFLGHTLQGVGSAMGGGVSPAPTAPGTARGAPANPRPSALSGVAGALSAPMQAPVLAPPDSFRPTPYSMGTPVHAGMVSPVGPATGRVADMDLTGRDRNYSGADADTRAAGQRRPDLPGKHWDATPGARQWPDADTRAAGQRNPDLPGKHITAADLDLRAIAAGAFGPHGSALDQNPFDINLPYTPGFRAADADFQEPGGVKPPGDEAHWTLREEDNFILAKNQRTGELRKLQTVPLTPAEKRQALAPHGAGPLGSDDPNRQRTEVHDMQMGASPGYGLGAGASMNPMSALAQFSQNATAYGRRGGATGPGAAVGQQYADADLSGMARPAGAPQSLAAAPARMPPQISRGPAAPPPPLQGSGGFGAIFGQGMQGSPPPTPPSGGGGFGGMFGLFGQPGQGGNTLAGAAAAAAGAFADADLTQAPTHKVERARAPFQFDHDADEIYRPVPGDIAGGTERDRKLPAPAIKAADLDFRALTKTQYADRGGRPPPKHGLASLVGRRAATR